MVQYTVKITNSKQVTKKLGEMPQHIRDGAKQAVRDSVMAIRADARKRVAVDSGKLKKSIRFRVAPDGLSAIVKAHEYYGVFVEFGTTSMKARPFMKPAAMNERTRFPHRVSADVRKALGF